MSRNLAVTILTPSLAASRALAITLARQADLEVVAAATDPRATLPVLRASDVLLHHTLRQEQTSLVLAAVRSSAGRVRALVFGVPRDGDVLARYFESGVRGYVLAGEPFNQLVTTLRAIGRGEIRVDAWLTPYLMRRYHDLEQQVRAKKLLRDAVEDW